MANLFFGFLRANCISTNLTTRIQINAADESRDHIRRVMHAEIDSRNPIDRNISVHTIQYRDTLAS